jgi:hypothetical protein
MQDLIEGASDLDLAIMLECVRAATEDRRRKQESTYLVDEAVLKSRREVLQGQIDASIPVEAYSKLEALEQECNKANEAYDLLKIALDVAGTEVRVAEKAHRWLSRPWTLERNSINKQLISLRAARKRKIMEDVDPE